jgi:methylmalonyl-CoA mutase C-terminal domain/subunit
VTERKIKVLLAKPGLDGHDVGAKVVVQALLDAGFEVTYTGLRQTPEAIAKAAKATNADVVGLSILSGTHLPLCRRVRDLLLDHGLHDKLWIVGGNIPENDRMVLRQLGYRGVFPTGSRTEEIVTFIRENVKLPSLPPGKARAGRVKANPGRAQRVLLASSTKAASRSSRSTPRRMCSRAASWTQARRVSRPLPAAFTP